VEDDGAEGGADLLPPSAPACDCVVDIRWLARYVELGVFILLVPRWLGESNEFGACEVLTTLYCQYISFFSTSNKSRPKPPLPSLHHPPIFLIQCNTRHTNKRAQGSCSSMSATLRCGRGALLARAHAVAFLARSSSSSTSRRHQRALDSSITTEDKLAKDSKRRRERADSVSEAMLQDRRRHLGRIAEMAQETEAGEAEEDEDDSSVEGGGQDLDPETLQRIRALGLGQKQRGKDTSRYRRGPKDEAGPSEIGATGFATYMAAASGGGTEGWPVFKHMLPEVAFAGHSNCGKSSLVNAVAGMAPRRGVARVSDRAGWTDAVFFYQLGKKPPVLTLADLPGYGHAVASVQQKRRWRDMTNDYFVSRRVLSLCCVLVDCVRGLCKEDQDLLRSLRAKRVPVKVILTKGDLLDEGDLARSHAVVVKDMQEMGLFEEGGREGGREGGKEDVLMVSASTGAGVSAVWKALVGCTRKDVVYKGDIGLHRASLR